MTALHRHTSIRSEIDREVRKRALVGLDLVVVLPANEEDFLALGRRDVLHVHLEWPLELEVDFRDDEVVLNQLAHHELSLVAVDGLDRLERAPEDLLGAGALRSHPAARLPRG